MKCDDRLTFPISHAVLDDAADVARIDGQQLARDFGLRDLRLDFIGDAIEPPAECVADHRDGLCEPNMSHGPILDLFHELLGREAGADLLLERQAADARILNTVDDHSIDALADSAERDRHGIHRKSRIHARAQDGDPGLPGQCVHATRVPLVHAKRIRELFGRGHDRRLELKNGLELRHDLFERGAGAVNDDVRLRRLQGFRGVALHLDAVTFLQAGDVGEIAADLRRIDVDGADDRQSRPLGNLLRNGGADWSEAEVQHADCGHF